MDVPEPDLLNWVMGAADTPEDYDTALFRRLCEFHGGKR
jgi:succinate dehydrogenase flavin-adding protein (antitoxin of CptAB toxin-antitoxin module)